VLATDIDGNDKVDMKNIALVYIVLSTTSGSPEWNSMCDVNHDDKIDTKDMILAARDVERQHEHTVSARVRMRRTRFRLELVQSKQDSGLISGYCLISRYTSSQQPA